MKKELRQSLLLLIALLLAGTLAFWQLFQADNKYTAALPGGRGYNVLQPDPERVGFLVDGWEYYPGELLSPDALQDRRAEQYAYVGEYPNFSAHLGSPYGTATYRLTLRNAGGPVELSLFLPELLCAGKVYINGELAGENGALVPYAPLVQDGVYAFRAGKDTQIVIQCANYTHYYSGMYYPPAVGTPGAVARMTAARLLVYGFFCFGSLAVALSNLGLWLLSRDRLSRLLEFLCLAFALRLCYPFLRALGVPLVRPLYAVEDLCGSAVLLCAILLAGELSGQAGRPFHRGVVLPGAVGMCAVTAVFPLFILSYAPSFINPYGFILFAWKFLASAYLLWLSLHGERAGEQLNRYLLCAAGAYGLSLGLSVVSVGRFEPIRGAWPEEYGGFALVVGFAVLMARRGARLSEENRRLNCRLQEEVDRKTRALETLLSERKELLASLIHDLKNPLAAMRGYADLVRSGGVALDRETAGYLDALSERMSAVEDRFHQLQSFSRRERLSRRPLCLNEFLAHFYADNRPDMELNGQSFLLELPRETLTAAGDEARLRSALENLCYNAVSFTPCDGTVILSLQREGDKALVCVTDTGPGIAPEDLPHIFDRGFTRRDDGGEGLGLFIVRTVALEHGGTVEAASRSGGGSVFTLRLPLTQEES